VFMGQYKYVTNRTLLNKAGEEAGMIAVLVPKETGMAKVRYKCPECKHSEVTEEEWDQTLNTCLKAMFFLSQAAAKIMIPQGGGKIINFGSTFGQVTFKGRSVYAAAKAGVHHLTRALAYEWAEKGINVNAIAPCITETPTRKELLERPGYKEWVLGEMLPIRRWAQPEDFIGATLFLCSALSDMVVGHVVMVDGGWIIH